MSSARRRVVSAGLLSLAVAAVVAGCGNTGDRPAADTGAAHGPSSGSASGAASPAEGGRQRSGFSADEIAELEKTLSTAEGDAAQAERDATAP